MIRIKRPAAAPACLNGAGSAAQAELAAATLYYATPQTQAYSFKVYRRAEVKTALMAMCRFKCAFCECDFAPGSDGDVEHYRPKGALSDGGHPGYWWLAATWSNLLLSCEHCNQTRKQIIVDETMSMAKARELQLKTLRKPPAGKASQFPILGTRQLPTSIKLKAEKPLLLDPTRCDPVKHIRFVSPRGPSLALPVVRPKGIDPYGEATIKITALNRFALVRSRTIVLMELRKHVLTLERALKRAERAASAGDAESEAEAQEDAAVAMAAIKARAAPNLPFSAVALWLHRDLVEWLQAEKTTRRKLPVPLLAGGRF